MPDIGPMEIILVLAIALLVLGPSKLPEIGKSLGASIREFRKATTDVQESMRLDARAPAAPPAPAAAPAPAAPPEPAAAPVAVAPAPAVASAPVPPAPQPPTQSPGSAEPQAGA
jgi:sec-independent protein translocase protein TatA